MLSRATFLPEDSLVWTSAKFGALFVEFCTNKNFVNKKTNEISLGCDYLLVICRHCLSIACRHASFC